MDGDALRGTLRKLAGSPFFWGAWAVELLVVTPVLAWLAVDGNMLAALDVIVFYPVSFAIAVVSVSRPLQAGRSSLAGALCAAAAMTAIQFFGLLVVGWLAMELFSRLPHVSAQSALEASACVAEVVSVLSGVTIAEAARAGVGEAFRRGYAIVRSARWRWLLTGAAIYAADLLLWWPFSHVWPQFSFGYSWLSAAAVSIVAGLYSLAVEVRPVD